MTQAITTPDHLIDPRLHRLDNLGRAVRRSRSYENKASVANPGFWRGPSIRTCPNLAVGLDSNVVLQGGSDTPGHTELPSLDSGVKETCDKDWLLGRDSNGSQDSDSEYDSDSHSNSENELFVVGDQVSLAIDNHVPMLKQSESQLPVSQAPYTATGSVFGSPSPQLAFTPEISREATAAFSPNLISAIPCKSLEAE